MHADQGPQPQFDAAGNLVSADAGRDKNIPVVYFYTEAHEDGKASAKEGRPMFRDVEMLKIAFPADRQRTIVVPALEVWKKVGNRSVTYAQRFGEQYKRFKAGQQQSVTGTPLEKVPFLSKAQVLSLKALDILTLEQLASISGQATKNLGMHGLTMVSQAQEYMKNAKGSANVTALAAENALLRETIAQMEKAQGKEPEVATHDEAQGDKGAVEEERAAPPARKRA